MSNDDRDIFTLKTELLEIERPGQLLSQHALGNVWNTLDGDVARRYLYKDMSIVTSTGFYYRYK